MLAYATPGLYRQDLEPRAQPGPLMRGDISVFLGYTGRGPVSVPVRIQSLSQFEQVFGPALVQGFLWHSVKGFFECGGRTAYVLRLTGTTARAAAATIGGSWTAEAAFSWSLVDPRRLTPEGDAETAVWQTRVENEIREGGLRRTDPGGWGNQIAVQVGRTALLITETTGERIANGAATRLGSLAGIEMASVLELTQTAPDGASHIVRLMPARIEPAFGLVHWPVTLQSLGLDPDRSIRLASVEFDVSVYSAGISEQSFTALAPHPTHSRALTGVMTRDCRSVTLIAPFDGDPTADWTDPAHWPDEDTNVLSGGFDGLESINGKIWDVGLDELKKLTDAALIAAPDLMPLEAGLPVSEDTADAGRDCCNLSPAAPGFLQGRVLNTDETGTERPVPKVLIDVSGIGASVLTDSDGNFSLTGISLGLVTLRLSKTGFAPLETVAQGAAFPNQPGPEFKLQKLNTPAVLPVEERARLQRAMGNPAVVGPYKVAIIDPPAANTDIESLRAWRTRLGDWPRLGLFAPWLRLPAPGAPDGQLACPPSGHVCGTFARAELSDGIHRSGANQPLRYAQATTRAFNDGDQAGLNPVGINAIRAFPGRGIRVNGTRSLAASPEWLFLTTRRIIDAIERTLERALAWMVFEPNSDITRQAVQTSAVAFLDGLYRQGILAGVKPDAAYRVKCDLENNPQDSRDQGRLVLEVAVAPTVPYEFIIFRLGHSFDALQVTERTA